ncbi:hypothetical protein EDC01DRAFT_726857 [Geopyxis carbonaria]|nr:hypothetical protein EDC01DRAFT_726857 [Geopyxis carbonaria]
MGKRRPPISKRKNRATASTASSESPEFAPQVPQTPETPKTPLSMSKRNCGLGSCFSIPAPARQVLGSKSPNSVNKAKRPIQKWEPAAHTCGACNEKTTSANFKRHCLGEHEIVCPRFHKTLMRTNKADACSACINEDRMMLKRKREVDEALAKLKNCERKAAIKQLQGHVTNLEREFVTCQVRTGHAYEERKSGYEIWASAK